MKTLLALLALAALMVWSGYWAFEDPGYVLIQQGGRSLESTALLAFWLVVLVALVSPPLVRFTLNLLTLPQGIRRWRLARKARQGKAALDQGLIHYLLLRAGHKSPGLDQAAAYGDSPAGALLYAEVLTEQGYLDEALKQLEAAEARFPRRWELPALRCQRLLEAGRGALALPLLEHLRQYFPKAPLLPLLEYQWCIFQGELEAAKPWLTRLRKQKKLPESDIDHLEARWYQQSLDHLLEDRGTRLIHKDTEFALDPKEQQTLRKQLQHWWKQLPSRMQQRIELRKAYLEALVRLDFNELAFKVAQSWVTEGHLETLLPSFKGLSASEDHLKQFTQWAHLYPSDAISMLIAEQEIGLEQWTSAQQRLEALAQKGNEQAQTRLLFVYLKTGQPMAAKQLAAAQINA